MPGNVSIIPSCAQKEQVWWGRGGLVGGKGGGSSIPISFILAPPPPAPTFFPSPSPIPPLCSSSLDYHPTDIPLLALAVWSLSQVLNVFSSPLSSNPSPRPPPPPPPLPACPPFCRSSLSCCPRDSSPSSLSMSKRESVTLYPDPLTVSRAVGGIRAGEQRRRQLGVRPMQLGILAVVT